MARPRPAVRRVAEFARPGRASEAGDLVAALLRSSQYIRTADGGVDVDVVQAMVEERSHRAAAATLCQSPIGAAGRVYSAPDLDPELRGKFEAAAVPLVYGRTPGQLRPLIDRRVLTADPDAARNRRAPGPAWSAPSSTPPARTAREALTRGFVEITGITDVTDITDITDEDREVTDAGGAATQSGCAPGSSEEEPPPSARSASSAPAAAAAAAAKAVYPIVPGRLPSLMVLE